MDRDDMHSIRKYTFKSELDKALHTLEGILKGVSIDGRINTSEVQELRDWGRRHYEYIDRHPYNELVPIVLRSVEDNVLDPEEIRDILWMASNLKSDSLYYNVVTSDLQRLEGVLHGILADNVISDDEVEGLSHWLFANEQLKGSFPYDELCSLITAIRTDGIITDEERKSLKLFFSDFVDVKRMKGLNHDELADIKKSITISGICALDPDIIFPDHQYCLTGIFHKHKKSEIASMIVDRGGRHQDSLCRDTNYLVIGAEGNPCWAFSCYGRKVEKAVAMRKDGLPISLVHESDLMDALQ